MLKLIKLELRKVKIGFYIKRALFANLVVILIFFLMIISPKDGRNIEFTSFINTFIMVESLIKAVFIIFASVLLSRFVIEEYKNKTITVLFTYPINRKKLIISKLMIVVLFTFIAIVLSNILVDFILYNINIFYNFVPSKLTMTTVIESLIIIFLNALVSSTAALIPMYVGMKKKSVPTTIVSSILIMFLICSNSGCYSLKFISIIPILLSILGIFVTYLSIIDIEHEDIII
ncbi:hypothetical protein CSC2_08610 [Clostridium zeae]|uniref:ABC transporter permease n=1 Tax=Clostridium zeae TaxID=2759022 RepID=A0ABQ1E6D7_9CLOT|nr:ABC transporter permease [Clostridium zeae]GFZ30335.1 hypothetical protein CSC2_08610 [Clostridium zeae]